MAAFFCHFQLRILLVVAKDGVHSSFDGAAVWFKAASEQVQQGGFSRAVSSKNSQSFSLAEDIGKILQNILTTAIRLWPVLGNIFQLQNGATKSASSHLKGKAFVCGKFFPVNHAVNGIHPSPCLGASCLGAPQKPFPLCPQHRFNALFRVGFYLCLCGLFFQILGIVSRVELDSLSGQLVDGGTHVVQEVAVVGNHQHSSLGGSQVFLQPGDGLHVKLVGGLVQKQQSCVINKHLCQSHLLGHAARKTSHGGS